eukprot:scaffold29329_cov53-Cyclotella_meneghiniana.AAC.2
MSHRHLPLFSFRQNENVIVSFIDCAPLFYMYWKWSILLWCPAGKRQIHVMGDWHRCNIGGIQLRGASWRVG